MSKAKQFQFILPLTEQIKEDGRTRLRLSAELTISGEYDGEDIVILSVHQDGADITPTYRHLKENYLDGGAFVEVPALQHCQKTFSDRNDMILTEPGLNNDYTDFIQDQNKAA